MLEDAAHRVALDVARSGELLGAVELDLEHETRLAQGQGQLADGKCHVAGLVALAVDDGGHETVAARAAGRALAEVVPVLSLDADLHVCSSYVSVPRA